MTHELWIVIDSAVMPAIPVNGNGQYVPCYVTIYDKVCVDDGLLTPEKIEKYRRTFASFDEDEYLKTITQLNDDGRLILSQLEPMDMLRIGSPSDDALKIMSGCYRIYWLDVDASEI